MLSDKVFIKWQESLSVGIPSIDSQHKVLVDTINALFDIILDPEQKRELTPIFKTLELYTKEHFDYEEHLFDKYEWKGSATHKNEHQILIKELNRLKKEISTSTDMASSIRLMEFLKAWLVDHIMESDMKFSGYLKSRGAN